MKKIISIVLAAASIAACSFLEEVNPVGIDNTYNTKELLETSIEGVHGGYLHTFGLFAGHMKSYTHASGLFFYGRTGQGVHWGASPYRDALNFTQYSSDQSCKWYFQAMYRSIQRANVLLDALPSSPVEDSFKDEIAGEARFVRAVMYFHLVREFGDLPLRIGLTDAYSASFCPRSPYYKIYEQIVDDFEFAQVHMRTPERVREITPELARPNKYAATAYLSSVYTTIGSLLAHPDDNFWDSTKEGHSPDFSAIGVKTSEDAYRKALEYAEKLIPESATHDAACPYRLLDNFGDLYNYDIEHSFTCNGNTYTSFIHPEQIYVISSSIQTSKRSASFEVPVNHAYTLPKLCEGTKCDKSFTNYGVARPTRFVFQKWAGTYPGQRGVGSEVRYQNDTVYLNSTDPRFDLTFYHSCLNNNDGTTLLIYPLRQEGADNVYSYPYLRKYWSRNFDGEHSDASCYMMRLAEVYFNAAEAAAALGDETTARKYIEVIHNRARHSVKEGQPISMEPTWNDRTFGSKEELLLAIFWERTFELYGEEHEYYDTHRFGSTWLVENIAKPINEFLGRHENKDLILPSFYPKDFRYSEDPVELRKSMLCSFPQYETDTNGAIGASHLNDFDWGL